MADRSFRNELHMSMQPPHNEPRSSVSAHSKAEASSKRSATPSNPEAITPLILPKASDDEQPTIISQQRKASHFDSKIGESLVGRKLSHFELLEPVGAGGMAAVIRARDLDLNRIVALKILPPDMAVDPENVQRFRNEAKAAAKLDHDNIARVYHFGEDQGLHFIAFEFVEGDNLRELMEANGGRIPIAEGVSVLLQVAAGLSHAFERGITHRDIKPSNIIVTPDGRAKIVDMGLARSNDNRVSGQLTQSNVTLGTFDYISPEQAIEPRLADVRSDIYSLGCTFYHAFTGHVPVPEGTAAKKLDFHKNALPPDPRTLNPEIPDELAAVLGRMMAKNADLRYQHPDHLAAHVRTIAKKLGIATGPAPLSISRYDDHPIPPPPKLSWSWIATTGAVLLLIVFVLVNANTNNEPPPPWPRNNNAKYPTAKTTPEAPPPPVVTHGPQDADDTAEFAALLKAGAKHIRLTSDEYDLSLLNLEGAFTGDDLKIEGVRMPVLRLGYASTVTALRPKSLTLRGTGTLTIRGLRVQAAPSDTDPEAAAMVVSGFERVVIEQCQFRTPLKPTQTGPALLYLSSTNAMMKQCYFAPGAVGVQLASGAKFTANECAIGPQYAVVRVSRAPDESGESEVKFERCSMLMMTGAVVDIDDNVPCYVQAGRCLFGGPTVISPFTSLPVVIQQRGVPASTTRYEVLKNPSDSAPLGNLYHNVAAYAAGDRNYTFAECALEKPFIRDVEHTLKGSPWEARDPLAILDSKSAEPKKAFVQNLRYATLAGPTTRQRELIGTMYWANEQLHPTPLALPDNEPRDATVKIWDPSLSPTKEDLPPGVYPTLKMAIAAVRKGDTLLIRHTGRLEIDPCEFDKADTNLTIKPEGANKPLLVPVATTLKKAHALFKLYGGRLVLDGLHFRLPADRTPAIVAIPGSGSVECKNAIITFDDGDDLNAVVLTDPKNEMMLSPTADRGPPPKILFDNVVLRGRGRLLNVRSSRAFELDVKNSLAALDATLIEIDPASGDPTANGHAIVRFNRTTTYLSGNLLHFKAGDKKTEMGPSGLAKTDVNATNCLFVPATDNREAFVRADRFDTREQVEKWFAWAGRNNLYGYDKKKVMLEIRVTDLDAMPVKMINGDRWLELASEEGDPFTSVRFELVAPEAGRAKAFAAIRPNDFRVKSFDPLRPDGEPELGAPLDLPRPLAEE